MALLIIESPNKVAKLRKILGNGYKIMATKGHVLDLPPKDLGVDTDNEFEPTYQTIRGKGKVLNEIIEEAKKHSNIYLATDPDREGEAIAAHVASKLPQRGKTFHRVLFHAITAPAVRKAIEEAGTIDQNLYDAQQARRVTDRLVGYLISPIMWRKGLKGSSAGRVQSVALKYAVDREREIESFVPEEYWESDALMEGDYKARFEGIRGNEKVIREGKLAGGIRNILMESCRRLRVASVETKTRTRTAAPPFTTSTLQQAANGVLNWDVSKTMRVAQKLFEAGVITYHRTDSVAVDKEVMEGLRQRLSSQHGATYVSDTPNRFKAGKASQEAHEAIRPTEDSADLTGEEARLLDLIRRRFEASQMAPAQFEQVKVEFETIDTKVPVNFVTRGSRCLFDGFLKVYGAATEDVILPVLVEGDEVPFTDVEIAQKFTQPPPRYSDATLVKKMEKDGVGRPATYASIIEVLKKREFILKEGKTFRATDKGKVTYDYMARFFPDIVDPAFTSQMETTLDEIAEGTRGYLDVLQKFHSPLDTAITAAYKGSVKELFRTEHKCPECGEGYLLRRPSKNGGVWYACERYPKCKTAAAQDENGNLILTEDGKPQAWVPPKKDEAEEGAPACPECGKPMRLRKGRYGDFYGCSGYPDCKAIVNLKDQGDGKKGEPAEREIYHGVLCKECSSEMYKTEGRYGEYLRCTSPDCKGHRPIPQGICPECGDFVSKKYSRKKKRHFYSCDGYPQCDFATNKAEDLRPLPGE